MPSDKGEIVLGVDLDGVCADFYARMREIAAEWLEVGLETLTTDVSYGLGEWGIRDEDHYRQLHRFAVTQRDLFETCVPIRGAATTLRRLSDEGYRIRIITHRLFINFFHEASVRQTIRWLDKHGVPYRDLCFMGEKDQVGADVYIDDSPANIAGLRAAGHYAICFANSANKGIEAPRARKWDEVYQLIKQRWPGPGVGGGS
jgi:5'(3')-deoxyribonucleotidase